VIEINFGSEISPKIIKIRKGCFQEERRQIETLIREYKDVFAWTYDDLKAYKGDIILHTIPLRKDAKPFRQKQRRMNQSYMNQSYPF
jgi:Mg2+ and Co2+ transporter CorA